MQFADFDFQQNFFRLFGQPECFRLDSTQLDQQYHALQMQVHPDKFAHLSEAERRVSMQWATRANEAYQVLRNPLKRARYLLGLHGVDTQEETNTSMPMDFLLAQMEWREAVEQAQQAGDLAQLEKLEARLQQEVKQLQDLLGVKLDDEQQYAPAAEAVRKLKFMEKLAEEIASAFDVIDT
jgi:molecular chaperone HscB